MGKLDKYLALFDLDYTFDEDDLKKAYRILSKVWHPDRFESNKKLRNNAEEKFKEINNGYEFLKTYLESQNQYRSAQNNSDTDNKNKQSTEPNRNHNKQNSDFENRKKEYTYEKTNSSKDETTKKKFIWSIILVFLVIAFVVKSLMNTNTTSNITQTTDQVYSKYNNGQQDKTLSKILSSDASLAAKGIVTGGIDREGFFLDHKKIISKIFSINLNIDKGRKRFFKILSEGKKYSLYKRHIDLNNDGKKDYIIENHSYGYVGSGGYRTYIFIYYDGHYRFVQRFFGGPIKIIDGSTGNYKNLSFTYKNYLDKGGFKDATRDLVWNGSQYIKSKKYWNQIRNNVIYLGKYLNKK